MPGLNKTGPDGNGPMTGRKMGRCTNFGAAFKNNNTNDVAGKDDADGNWRGRGFGRGRGAGAGRGRGRGMGNRNRYRGGE